MNLHGPNLEIGGSTTQVDGWVSTRVNATQKSERRIVSPSSYQKIQFIDTQARLVEMELP